MRYRLRIVSPDERGPVSRSNERKYMTINETINKSDVQGLSLETETVFECVADARAWLSDNYTTGEFLIFWDECYGAYVYNAD